MKPIFSLLMISSVCALSACAPFKPANHEAGVCNELNSQIIFSGNTSDTRKAEIEDAELPLTQQNYDKHCQ